MNSYYKVSVYYDNVYNSPYVTDREFKYSEEETETFIALIKSLIDLKPEKNTLSTSISKFTGDYIEGMGITEREFDIIKEAVSNSYSCSDWDLRSALKPTDLNGNDVYIDQVIFRYIDDNGRTLWQVLEIDDSVLNNENK